MQLSSAIAIYFLFLAMSAFLVLPFGVRTHEEVGAERVPGQADSAPARFSRRQDRRPGADPVPGDVRLVLRQLR
jgi:predicted secreted protein